MPETPNRPSPRPTGGERDALQIRSDEELAPTKRVPTTMAGELGSTGLKRYADDYAYIEEEWLPQLRGSYQLSTYREMSQNDPIIGAILFVVDMLMRKIEWNVEPFDDTEEHADNALFVEECMQDMDMAWSDVISELMSFLVYGWSLLEIVYKRRTGHNNDETRSSRFDDGRIGWARLPIRAQDTLNGWQFEHKSGRITGMRQLSPPDWQDVEIPANRFLLFRTTARRNSPEGVSILRTAYRPWWFKKRMEEIEGIGIERDLAGLPVVYMPHDFFGPADKLQPGVLAIREEMKQLVTRVRRDRQEGVLMPSMQDSNGNELFKFELLSTGGARQFNTNEVIGRYEARIAMTVLADFLLLGTQNVGSWALSSDKVNLFNEALKTWATMIADVFNRQAIPRLFKLNGLPPDELPKLVPGEIVTPNLGEIGDFITKLSGAGFNQFPNEEFEDYLYQLAHFPEINEETREQWAQQKELELQQAAMGVAAMGMDMEGTAAGVEQTKATTQATKTGIQATKAGIESTKAGTEATRRSTQLMGKDEDTGAAKPGATAPRKRTAAKKPRA